MVNHLSSTDFYPFGNPIQKVATTNPPRFALRPSQPAAGPLPLMAAGGQGLLWQPSGWTETKY